MTENSAQAHPALDIRDLNVSYPMRGGLFRTRARTLVARSIDLKIEPGTTLGLVGESGSGKTTIGRSIVRLVKPDSGTIHISGKEISQLSQSRLRPMRRDLQMVFQDPNSSLDPSMLIADTIAEPLDVHEKLTSRQRTERVRELANCVGLTDEHLARYPYELSGGQRQRVAIARAIALNPPLIVCDEAVSALDVSTQSQIINLLEDIQQSFGIAYLFISHDLAVVRHISQTVAVLYLGKIVEFGPTEQIFERASHPYTRALLSAVPQHDVQTRNATQRIILRGDMPDTRHPPSGCTFHTRCPFVMDLCRTEDPGESVTADGGTVRCHLHTTGPALAGGTVMDLPLPTYSPNSQEPSYESLPS